MSYNDVLDKIIRELDPDEVPIEFISSALVTDLSGHERVVTGSELKRFLANPDFTGIMETRIVLDLRKISRAITAEVDFIFDEVNRLYWKENDL